VRGSHRGLGKLGYPYYQKGRESQALANSRSFKGDQWVVTGKGVRAAKARSELRNHRAWFKGGSQNNSFKCWYHGDAAWVGGKLGFALREFEEQFSQKKFR